MTKTTSDAANPHLAHDELTALADRGDGRLKAMAAEILRLRTEVADTRRCLGAAPDELTWMAAEKRVHSHAAAVANCQRLRDERHRLIDERDAARAEAAVERLGAGETDDGELSQLRQALGLLSTLAPSLVMDTADPLGMAKRIEAVVIHGRESAEKQLADSRFAVQQLQEEKARWSERCRSRDERIDRVTKERDSLRSELAETTKALQFAVDANTGLAAEAKAVPDVAARERCLELLRDATKCESRSVSAGIEELVKMKDAWKQVATEHEDARKELTAECDRRGKRGEETFVAFVRRLAVERDEAAKRATANEFEARHYGSLAVAIGDAHRMLDRAGISGRKTPADRIRELVGQRDAAVIAAKNPTLGAAPPKVSTHPFEDRPCGYNTLNHDRGSEPVVPGWRGLPWLRWFMDRFLTLGPAFLSVADVQRAHEIVDALWKDELAKLDGDCGYPNCAAGTGPGVQMAGCVAPAPGAKDVPDITDQEADFWKWEGQILVENLAAVSQLATSRNPEHFPMLVERAAVRDVRKLLDDYLRLERELAENRQAMADIAKITGDVSKSAAALAGKG